MRTSVALLASGLVGVLVGGFVVGVSDFSWYDEVQPIQLPILTSSGASSTIESNVVSQRIAPVERTSDLDPTLHVESILESTSLASDFDQSVSLYLLLARADTRDVERYINESLSISTRNQRVAALSIIFGRYAAIDPNTALDRVLSLNQLTLQERSNVIRSIFNEWTVGNLEEAVAAIEGLPPQYKFSAASAIMWRSDFLSAEQRIQLAQQIGLNDGWVANTVAAIRSEASKVDPRKAFYDRVRETTYTQEHYAELLGIVRHWFELEGSSVLTEINESLDNRNMRRSVLNTLIWNAIATNTATPSDVLKVVSEFPNRQDAKETVQHVFRSWSNLEPKESFEASFDVGDPLVNLDFRKSLLQIWATKDAEGLLLEASSLTREYQDIAVVVALGQLSRKSPEDAIRIARGLDTNDLRVQARDEIVQQWSSVNAKAAFEWLINDGLNVGDQSQTTIIHRAFSSYINQDFESARRFASEYRGEQKTQLIGQIARHLIYSDLERAIDYLPNIVDETSRAELQFEIGRKLVDLDPFEALSYGENVHQNHKDSYYNGVVWNWAYKDFTTLHINIHRVPSEYRSDAADALLRRNEEMKKLSERDIRKLESMVTKHEGLIISAD